jgi:uncharacterized protein YjbJ (UPF0337 family)
MPSAAKVAPSAKSKKLSGLKSSARDNIEGSAITAAGIIKEETGKALGNPGLQAEGNVDQLVGKVQKGIGKIKKALGN